MTSPPRRPDAGAPRQPLRQQQPPRRPGLPRCAGGRATRAGAGVKCYWQGSASGRSRVRCRLELINCIFNRTDSGLYLFNRRFHFSGPVAIRQTFWQIIEGFLLLLLDGFECCFQRFKLFDNFCEPISACLIHGDFLRVVAAVARSCASLSFPSIAKILQSETVAQTMHLWRTLQGLTRRVPIRAPSVPSVVKTPSPFLALFVPLCGQNSVSPLARISED